ncbi:acylpyruvase FAHD1, mitochondrial-like [Saccostrea echinata]|uniref:acylpyruvase FAHD1, mitochondrial-like n=1 Tax=Saccostrea echinata TaxID=191078 RepID=UPI002A824D15|nr:acylpyruvase FAHD1, mitochondrial-like [Saccostrea echinata]
MSSEERLKTFTSLGKKVMAVGRNYRALAAEQGNPIPEKPIVFMKPTSSFITEGRPIKIPLGCERLYFEVELGVIIKRQCSNVKKQDVDNYIGGYCLVLDMTAQDFQVDAKAKGHPWCLSKGFDTACPVSAFIPKQKIKDYNDIELWLKVNDVIKQRSSTSDMIFSIPHVISYVSSYITLEEGDVVITGSPAGAGPVKPGELIEAGLADVVSMKFPVAT